MKHDDRRRNRVTLEGSWRGALGEAPDHLARVFPTPSVHAAIERKRAAYPSSPLLMVCEATRTEHSQVVSGHIIASETEIFFVAQSQAQAVAAAAFEDSDASAASFRFLHALPVPSMRAIAKVPGVELVAPGNYRENGMRETISAKRGDVVFEIRPTPELLQLIASPSARGTEPE